MRKSERVSVLLGTVLAIISLVGATVELHSQTPAGQTLDATGQAVLRRIIDSAQDPELRWPDFQPYQTEVKDFYARTGSTLGWVRDRKPTQEASVMIGLFTEQTTRACCRKTTMLRAGPHVSRNCKRRRVIPTSQISMRP